MITHCHTSVTLDNMVTIMVTSHEVIKKRHRRFWKDDIIQHVQYMVI